MALKKAAAKTSSKKEPARKSEKVQKFEKAMDGAKDLGSLVLTAFETGKRFVKDASDLISGDKNNEDGEE